MKLYILVEDGKSGHKIIDHWIPLLLPTLTRAKSIAEIQNNQYVLYSGMGYPRLLGTDRSSPEKNILGQTIDTINLYQTIDYLLIFLDGDDDGVNLRHQIVQQKIESYHRPLSCPYVIFVQNKCLETWLLGNRDLFPTTPLPNFLPFLAHYNVSIDDPEQMEKDPNFAFASTSALYHERYLRAMMQNLGYRYSKSRPCPIMYTESFINGLKKRIAETQHLQSLNNFFIFMDQLKENPPHAPTPHPP